MDACMQYFYSCFMNDSLERRIWEMFLMQWNLYLPNGKSILATKLHMNHHTDTIQQEMP